MKNRWIVLAAAVAIQTIFGGIYAWSTFVPQLTEDYGLSKGECGFIFGLTIAVFTLAMTFGGHIMAKIGPRKTVTIASLLFSAGYLAASFSNGSYLILLLAIGGLTGTGIGLGYVCPLAVCMKWFPKRKGLVTGVAVGGFGGGAILLSAIAGYFLKTGDTLQFFRWQGLIAGIILLFAAFLLIEPPNQEKSTSTGLNLKAIWNLPFGLLTLGIFSGTFAGLMIIGNLTEIAKSTGLTATQALSTISIFSLGNVIGRIIWGHLFDRLNYKAIPISLAVFACLIPMLLLKTTYVMVMLTVGLMGFAFGANFVVYAGAITKHFGTKNFATLYPICFLGYGLAGLTGPSAGGWLADATNSYNAALHLSTVIVSAAAILSLIGLSLFKKADTSSSTLCAESA